MIEEAIETIVAVSPSMSDFAEEDEAFRSKLKAEIEEEANRCIAERFAADLVSRVEHGPLEFKTEISTEDFMRGEMPRHYAVIRSNVWLTSAVNGSSE